ncbi:ABC transporter permease [Pseudofrankia inefficax]|uniref:Autoinducer 2 import system permease protein LsrD n=1 Tax=Pseudofrankia inefficax (strain DSM 45817 / CECT 9037 / DDB 130130 / EuI1c) TaxID=298654 RepID=E3J5G8_PSEI1|nr:ABC transporter permease [Pseudofrankia inefficax]ADP81912.1 inner-membrane translocator [Pseudofrankia inefficax]
MTSDIAIRPEATPTRPAGDNGSRPLWRGALRWESALVVLLIGVFAMGTAHSSSFLNGSNFFFIGTNEGEVAIMALPLLLIIMTGNIDLSVASMLGLAGTVTGDLFHAGLSIWLAMAIALLVGALGGALNGFLIAVVGLPSIAVTIGTLTLFRGIAEIVLAPRIITGFPISLTKIGVVPIPGTEISYSAAIFLGLAIITGVVLHATPLGRRIVAIGTQPEAARFSGVRVNQITFGLYVLSGLVCALAGILFTLKNSSASYDAGTGLELDVVAVVLFGGVSIFGGKGTVLGVALSAVTFGALLQALTQMGVQPEVQKIVVGLLLLASVVVPNLSRIAGRLVSRTRPRA